MLEKHFILEEADPVIFYGVNNANIRMLRALCPKLRIMARDNVVRVVGDEEGSLSIAPEANPLRRAPRISVA